MSLEKLKARAETLLRAISPKDFEGKAVYILPSSEWRGVPKCAAIHDPAAGGWVNSLLDLSMKPALEARGLWRGRGFATAVNDVDFDGENDWYLFVVLHEVCHWFDFLKSGRGFASLNEDHELAKDFVSDMSRIKTQTAAEAHSEHWQQTDRPLWENHGLDFIRAGCHIAYRASLLGFPCELQQLKVAGSFYGLSPAEKYEWALADEVRERTSEPITSILRSTPPVELSVLFRMDSHFEERRRKYRAEHPPIID